MKRTQIYIDENMFNFLEREGKAEHKSVSELVRESLDEKVRYKISDMLKKTEKVFGIWKDKKISAEDYVRNMRKDRKIW
ncbi:MAG: ribbon-helix-helix protein, CopG family [bacterium]